MDRANEDKLEFVSAIITDKEKRPLILKRCNNLRLDPGKYDMCSGHMKNGEIPLQSMYRELNEELGMQPNNILKIKHLADIETPHKQLLKTVTHIYHVETNLTQKQINEKIEKTEEREIQEAKYLKSVGELMVIQRYSPQIRTIYTKQMEEVYQMLQEDLYYDGKEEQWEER